MMSPLSNIDGKTVIKFIESLGYRFVRQRGSHMRYKNSQNNKITIHVKGKKVFKPGILKGLLNELGISSNSLFAFLK
jgi:predicted RNA binding protein YcfA (HicA-like mRNA interferase family)